MVTHFPPSTLVGLKFLASVLHFLSSLRQSRDRQKTADIALQETIWLMSRGIFWLVLRGGFENNRHVKKRRVEQNYVHFKIR